MLGHGVDDDTARRNRHLNIVEIGVARAPQRWALHRARLGCRGRRACLHQHVTLNGQHGRAQHVGHRRLDRQGLIGRGVIGE